MGPRMGPHSWKHRTSALEEGASIGFCPEHCGNLVDAFKHQGGQAVLSVDYSAMTQLVVAHMSCQRLPDWGPLGRGFEGVKGLIGALSSPT